VLFLTANGAASNYCFERGNIARPERLPGRHRGVLLPEYSVAAV